MNTATQIEFESHGNVFSDSLSLDTVRNRAPATFADAPDEGLSEKYTFIPTQRIMEALMNVGFVPIQAQQTRTRSANALHARHLIRLRRRFETVELKDAVPELAFVNSHDGSSRAQMRMAIYRAICRNGMIVSSGAFPAIHVMHRGNVLEQIVTAALQFAERFEEIAATVARMEERQLSPAEQQWFAERALTLRYPDLAQAGISASLLLNVRRIEDRGDDLWHVLNRVQENVIGGGQVRRAASGRLTRTRRITAIRRQLTMNERVWELGEELLAA